MPVNHFTIFRLGLLSLLVGFCFEVAHALPPGFIAETVTSKNAISGAFAKNPRNKWKPMLILVNKDGTVSVLEDPDESPDSTEILDLKKKLCTNTERGLQSVAIHPDFEDNLYVYLYYTKYKEGCLSNDSNDGPYNVIARFSMDPETLMLDYNDRDQIWRGAVLHDNVHNGGAMIFGNDDKLYVTTGDGGTAENSQDRRTVHGKLLRLNDDGGTPHDNPFTEANGYEAYRCRVSKGMVPRDASDDAVCSEIYSTGLRNPFRMSLDPNEKDKTLLAISDVGARTWEEINYAGTDYAGMDYGYEHHEGPCLRHSTEECPIPTDPNIVEPFYWYQHREDNGGCVAGSVFVPEGIWPDEYKFLFLDFVYYDIYHLIEDTENACRSCIPPIPNYRNETFYHSISYPRYGKNEAKMVDLFFGPYKDTQALYVVKFGNHDTVLRITYTGIEREPPLVNFEFEDRFYDIDEEVRFDGYLTKVPEDDELIFNWFFGDGSESSDINPIHTYDDQGSYTVTLIVSDSFGQNQEKSKTIQVGNPPSVKILSPVEGDQFYVGQVLYLKGEAFHANGRAFKDSELNWEVRKHHDDHFHPFLDLTQGNKLYIHPAPEPEDLHASTNSYLEIILYAIDTNGLVSKASQIVNPTLVEVDIISNSPGTIIFVNDEPIKTPNQVWSWKEQDIRLKVETSSPYVFETWSDGITDQERIETMNYSSPVFEAIFCVEDGGSCVLGFSSCCMGECNLDGSCGAPIKVPQLIETNETLIPLPDLYVTSAPSHQPSSSSRTISPTVSLLIPAPSSGQNDNTPSNLMSSESIDVNSNIMSAFGTPGRTFASIVIIFMAYFVAILLYKSKIQKDVSKDKESSSINNSFSIFVADRFLSNPDEITDREETSSSKESHHDTLIRTTTSSCSSNSSDPVVCVI